jgi:uncharacterized protein YgbK (DUF1537 family)
MERSKKRRDDWIKLAFYGDDFTGSTDALECICQAGLKALLFIEPPTAGDLEAFPHLHAFGVAGKTRSLVPAEMEKILIPAFEQMKAVAQHVHYKVCSTFDSSPDVGSIGKAIDCGATVFNNPIIPVLGGNPALGRYCAFGNLFARMGIGSNGEIYRIDRHPSMSRHPVTPMDESDLRVHLRKQTDKKIGLIDITRLDQPVKKWKDSISNEQVVLIDALYESQLTKIGEWFSQQLDFGYMQPLFSVGSSSIEMAMGKYWNKDHSYKPFIEWEHPGNASPLLVVSGSCSPVTTGQIEWAKANGFEEVELDAIRICQEDVVAANTVNTVNQLLQSQKNVIVHTGKKQTQSLSSEKLGTALGTIAKEAVKQVKVKRVVISGGDTSSYAARAMDITAVEMIAPLVTGAPLCKAYSKNKMIEGLEVNFKGGQVGGEDYFGVMVKGEL